MQTTTNLGQETLDKVQELIEVNLDSVKGFEEAAESIDQPAIANLFENLATTRSKFAGQLQVHVASNREKPEDSGTVKGAALRTWMKFRSAINGGDPKVVLSEAERGEDVIKAKYEEVLKETSGSPLNSVLMEQYAAIKAGHDRVRDLRDAYLEN